MKRGLAIALISLALIIPLISAYNGFSSISDYWQNEWVRFAVVFAVLFAIFYFAMHTPYTSNSPLIGAISAGLALAITFTLTQRGILYDYTGETIGNWAIIIGFFIAALALFKFLKRHFQRLWWLFGLIFIIIFFVFIDMWDVLPESLQYGPVGDAIDWLKGLSLTVIIIIVVAAFVLWRVNIWREKRGHYRQGRAIKAGELKAQRKAQKSMRKYPGRWQGQGI